ncbi:MAG: porin [Fluviicola sp.]
MVSKILFAVFFLLITLSGLSQIDSTKFKNVEISGYLETYYTYDFSNPQDHNRPGFFYSFNRHNELNLNLGFIRAKYEEKRVKGNLALMTGTYSRANLAHEPIVLRSLLEASIGYQLLKKRQLWLTAGVFPSHIGFESAVGADCWNLTRSILAENSPYYLSGAKLYYTTENEKWTYGVTVANGWQRIQRQPGNQLVGLGHQITYQPNSKWTFNSSSYIGSEFPDSTRRMRYFHDFYLITELTDKFGLIAGIDIGAEQASKNSDIYNLWYAPVLIARYKVSPKVAFAGRIEYYDDQNEVIISTTDGNGFATLGYSLNADFQLSEMLLWRVEARSLTDRRDIYFNAEGSPANRNTFVATSLSLSF